MESRRLILSDNGPANTAPTTEASGQCRSNGTLDDATGVIEVTDILVYPNDSAHGRYVETKERATYCDDDRQEVGIVGLWQLHAGGNTITKPGSREQESYLIP